MTAIRRAALGAAIAALTVLAPAAASAAPKVDGEFAVTSTPRFIAQGPDGNMWVTLDGSANDLARVTPAGVVTEFNPADITGPTGIARGPDGNMWVTQAGGVAKFAPANPTGATKFAIADIADPRAITLGPDNNLWTGSGDKVIRIPTANPAGFTSFPVTGLSARGIAAGTDGRLYIADFTGRVIAVTTAGAATPVTVGGNPQDVAAGPGGQIAYSNPGAMPQHVGRWTLGTTPKPTNLAGDPFGMTFGADGAYWTARFATSTVGRLTTSGQVTVLSGFSANSGPRTIAPGPNKTLWVALETAKKVGRITGLQTDTTAPVVSDVSVSPSPFRVGKGSTAIVKRAAPRNTAIRYRLSEKATVRLNIQRKLPGRRSGGTCVKPTAALRNAPRCTRLVTAVTLQRTGFTGQNRVAFTGRIDGKALPAGSYRVRAKATDKAGNASKARTAGFTIVR